MMRILQIESASDACMAGTFHSYGWVALAVTVAGLLGAIYSLAAGFRWLREDTETSLKSYAAKSWLLGLWVLVPPAWLYVESIFLFRHFGKAECFGQFRYAQELVSRGWMVWAWFIPPLLRKDGAPWRSSYGVEQDSGSDLLSS